MHERRSGGGSPGIGDRLAEGGRGPRPSILRIAGIVGGVVLAHALLVGWAWKTRALSLDGGRVLATLCAAVISAVLLGSVGEWLVHRFVMHGRWKPRILRAIYDLHHVGHHFVHFTPERYVHDGPINYIPVWPPEPDALCRSTAGRWLSMGAQFLFYSLVAVPIGVLPTAVFSQNPTFTLAFSGLLAVELFLFVRLHDSVHYPGQSWLERLPFFDCLDRHHYIHHVDTLANTNFLLPLGDLLFGTLRTSVTPRESARFPSYEVARRSIVVDVEDAEAGTGTPIAEGIARRYVHER